jgi:hypothetical protein
MRPPYLGLTLPTFLTTFVTRVEACADFFALDFFAAALGVTFFFSATFVHLPPGSGPRRTPAPKPPPSCAHEDRLVVPVVTKAGVTSVTDLV